jgi:hypothetical protein
VQVLFREATFAEKENVLQEPIPEIVVMRYQKYKCLKYKALQSTEDKNLVLSTYREWKNSCKM